MEEYTRYSTFEAFKPHFDTLTKLGYFKIITKSVSPIKRGMHVVYRYVVLVLIVAYNLQHVIRVVQVRDSMELVNVLFILLTTLNTLFKHVTFNVKSRRVDHIIEILNGPVFQSRNSYHVEVLKRNAVMMRRLLRLYTVCVISCNCAWAIFPHVNKALGVKVQFTGYIPFDTSSSPAFELANVYMSIVLTFQAYATVFLDCAIVSFYAQAKVQLQMLRFDLEHLADSEDLDTLSVGKKEYVTYKDLEDKRFKEVVQRRLVRCVVHHQLIRWFLTEIESIFAEALFFQFSATAWVICMTVYKIVGLSPFSAEFLSMALYLTCMLTQLFIFCYYGTQVKYESEFVAQSAYCGGWLSLSPGFRRQLLVIMLNCTDPIIPRTAYVVPISLETYVSVLRASYTLFTFLDRK